MPRWIPLFFALAVLPSIGWARKSVSFLRSHNFQLSYATTVRDWLGAPELSESSRWKPQAMVARNPELGAVYDDIESKDSTRVQRRLETSYGRPVDVEAKTGVTFRAGNFRQSMSLNAAAAVMVNNPVFPELDGILYNDFSGSSGYVWMHSNGWKIESQLQYGVRRTLERNYTVGQLVDSKPDVKLKEVPYRFYSEGGVRLEKSLFEAAAGINLVSVPLVGGDYKYWKVDFEGRSPELASLMGFQGPGKFHFWGAVSPFFGGAYNWDRTVRIGFSAAWWRFLRTDVFFFDDFTVAALASLRIYAVELEVFTFERAEDEHRAFRSRQTGLSLLARF